MFRSPAKEWKPDWQISNKVSAMRRDERRGLAAGADGISAGLDRPRPEPRAACQDGRADRAWPARLQQTGNRGICTIYSSPLALKPLLSGLSHPRHGDVRPRAAALAAKPLNKMQTGLSEAARAAVVTGLSLREAERAIAAPAAAQREVQDLCQLRLAGRWHRAAPENESAGRPAFIAVPPLWRDGPKVAIASDVHQGSA